MQTFNIRRRITPILDEGYRAALVEAFGLAFVSEVGSMPTFEDAKVYEVAIWVECTHGACDDYIIHGSRAWRELVHQNF
jgi:hypothetical protein